MNIDEHDDPILLSAIEITYELIQQSDLWDVLSNEQADALAERLAVELMAKAKEMVDAEYKLVEVAA